jgi:hypothetical protein
MQSDHRSYTDSVGKPNANYSLSEWRAASVITALTNLGVPADRLSTRANGEEDTVANNGTAVRRQMNRRVEIAFAPQKENVLRTRLYTFHRIGITKISGHLQHAIAGSQMRKNKSPLAIISASVSLLFFDRLSVAQTSADQIPTSPRHNIHIPHSPNRAYQAPLCGHGYS